MTGFDDDEDGVDNQENGVNDDKNRVDNEETGVGDDDDENRVSIDIDNLERDCPETFGEVLWDLREGRGKKPSQGVLAKRLNYSDSQVSRWETDETLPPDYAIVELICKILRCSSVERGRLRRAYTCDLIKERKPIDPKNEN
jgi:ribosome-binding protein aMBF1 (putative translation factor)